MIGAARTVTGGSSDAVWHNRIPEMKKRITGIEKGVG